MSQFNRVSELNLEARASGIPVIWRLISRPSRQGRAEPVDTVLFDGLFGAAAFILVLIFIAEIVDAPMAKVTRNIDRNAAHYLDIFSQIGASRWIMIVAAIVTIVAATLSVITRRRQNRAGLSVLAWRAGFIFVDIALAVALAQAIKFMIGRSEPARSSLTDAFNFSFFSNDAFSTSFPSGHTTTIFALATAMAIFIPRFQGFFLLLALAVATARLAIGVHYASDILGGMVLGVALTISLARYCARRRIVFQLVDGSLVRRGELLVRRTFRLRGRKKTT